MQLKTPYLVLLSFISIGCNNSGSSGSTKYSDSIIKTGIRNSGARNSQVAGCYRQVIGRDTILLHLRGTDKSLSGTMAFDNYEKDASHGTVAGRLDNGLILLWYDFSSEGMQSVTEIILKQADDDLIRGVGPITNRGDSTLFESHQNISFPVGNTMKRIDCADR